MPFVRIETNQKVDDASARALLEEITHLVHAAQGAPEDMIAGAVHGGIPMSFGGDAAAPAANLQVINANLPRDVTSALSRSLGALLQDKLGVSPARAYVFFQEFRDPHLVGWNRATFDEIFQARKGGQGEVLPNRLAARLVHPGADAAPIAGIDVEVWDRDGAGTDRRVGSASTDENGAFEVFYSDLPEIPNHIPALELRLYEPDQRVVRDGSTRVRRFLSTTLPVPQGGFAPDRDLGTVSVPFYEYDPASPFPYCAPETIRKQYSPGAKANIEGSLAKWGKVRDELIAKAKAKPGSVSLDDVQKAFPPTPTLALEKQKPGSTRTDEYFCDRLLNGVAPALFAKDPDQDGVYSLEYRFDDFEHTPGLELPNFRIRVKTDGVTLSPVDIRLQFRKPGQYQAGAELGEVRTFRPGDPDWDAAKRVARSSYHNVVGRLHAHLGRSHFDMEQYAVAFFRHVRKSPMRKLMFPVLNELLDVDAIGRKILLAPGAVLSMTEPITLGAQVKWVTSMLGGYDWKGWRPRQPICETHRYAKLAGIWWKALGEYVGDFFRTHRAGLVAEWGEIRAFSDEVVRHSVPALARGLEEPQFDRRFYDEGEIPGWRLEGKTKGRCAVTPITTSETPTDACLANLEQLCRYIMFQMTLWHSWMHNELLQDLGEMRFSGVLTNGSLGPESDDRLVANPIVSAVVLGSTYALSDFRYGFILANEEGEVDPALIAKLESVRGEMEKLGFDTRTLRSKINS